MSLRQSNVIRICKRPRSSDRHAPHLAPTPSSLSTRQVGICRQHWSFPQTSPFCPCRRNPRNSIRSRTSGSSCATTGSQIACSNPTTISSTIAAMLGISSSISPGRSCPSDCANGRTGSDQWDLVLLVFYVSETAILICMIARHRQAPAHSVSSTAAEQTASAVSMASIRMGTTRPSARLNSPGHIGRTSVTSGMK
jgi:hypothetical protein